MDVQQIPETLPPAITISREVAEFCLCDDLAIYGTAGPAALAWQWALTGEGPTPVALREWHRGAPDHDTLLDESRWPYGDGWGGRALGAEIERARFILWWLTASPAEEVPARFRRYAIASEPATAERGSATVILTEVYGAHGPGPFW